MISNLKKLFYYLFIHPYYKFRLGSLGSKSQILSPLHLQGAKHVFIDKNVLIQYKTWLASVPLTNSKVSVLRIGENSTIGNFNHIYATKSINIGKGVLTADRVYISDNLHNYEDINLPILNQPIKQIQTVEIGDGAWLGENVCVIGANVGKGSVIGANSVVTKNIPDYCVAVGAPARIIKRYDHNQKQWLKTNSDGSFI